MGYTVHEMTAGETIGFFAVAGTVAVVILVGVILAIRAGRRDR